MELSDWKTVEVCCVHYDSQGLQHASVAAPRFLSHVKSMASNFDSVNWEGVNRVVIDTDSGRSFQAGGWTAERGLFVDMY